MSVVKAQANKAKDKLQGHPAVIPSFTARDYSSFFLAGSSQLSIRARPFLAEAK
jgi:hypothetical protein